MFTSKDFVALLESSGDNTWPTLLMDVKDGQVWKEFEEKGFFGRKHNLGLMLNVDWFRPFKRSQYKVAGIFLTILNQPREERFKKKWTMLAGWCY